MITAIDITRDNFVGGCRLLAVQSDLIFYFDATYSGTVPDYLIVEATVDGVSYIIGKAIFLKDISANKRRFQFNASEFVRALVADAIDDFEQSDESIVETNVSRVVTVIVKSDIAGTVQQSFQFEAINAVRQSYEQPALTELAANNEAPYVAIAGYPVYIYFYGSEILHETSYALDYDDGVFLDYNGDKFVID